MRDALCDLEGVVHIAAYCLDCFTVLGDTLVGKGHEVHVVPLGAFRRDVLADASLSFKLIVSMPLMIASSGTSP